MDVQTRRAMREWTEQGSSLLPGLQRPLQVDGVTEEDVQGEVRRQIAAALENRDQQVRELQSENGELRQLLRAVVEGGDVLERVADTRQGLEREGQPGPRALEDLGSHGGVRDNYVLRQGELPRAPALPGFESQGNGGNPRGLGVRSQGDGGNPPGLEARSRRFLGEPVEQSGSQVPGLFIRGMSLLSPIFLEAV